MKLSNTMVSAIMIGAALVSAYAIGLLIRQVRTGSQPTAPVAADANEAARQARMAPGPGGARTNDTPEQRAQAKEKKAKMLEKMSAATKEEQEQFKKDVIKQVGGRRGGKMKSQGQAKTASEAPDANTPTSPKESSNPKQSAEKAGATP